jgi:hypothetical protein
MSVGYCCSLGHKWRRIGHKWRRSIGNQASYLVLDPCLQGGGVVETFRILDVWFTVKGNKERDHDSTWTNVGRGATPRLVIFFDDSMCKSVCQIFNVPRKYDASHAHAGGPRAHADTAPSKVCWIVRQTQLAHAKRFSKRGKFYTHKAMQRQYTISQVRLAGARHQHVTRPLGNYLDSQYVSVHMPVCMPVSACGTRSASAL